MKNLFISLICLFCSGILSGQNLTPIALLPPDTGRGLPVMKALALRASPSAFDSAALSLRDLSDLMWAANGVNRPNGKRTAPSAMNSQDIDVYAVMKEGIYLYNAQKHLLEPVAAGDYRSYVADRQENFKNAPIFCVLVSDISRFKTGEESQKMTWAYEDAGIVSQNICIFCAGVGLKSRTRAWMNSDKLKEVMKLTPSQHLILNNPVGR